ncbi:uncharacterized protein [Physcomitrium patens]|uniref:uncharacterized protein n=1 Tax=Physcomitrium patens TaxID=3218 RepID=UPI003CCE2B54
MKEWWEGSGDAGGWYVQILSWEFCGRSHEELLPRRLIVPQVNQLVQISQKYQSSQNGGAGASGQEMQTNCHLFVTSARQLAKNLELPTVNDLGYTKRYVRCLQISEVVNSMKDLIDHSRDNGYGPMASLHKFPRRSDGSSRSMLRIAQVRALQEQQQEQEQEQRGQHEEQEEQQEQEEEQQQEELELQSLLAETNTRGLSGLQEHFEEENEVDGQGAEGLEEAISGGAEADPLSSFFESNSLAALQTSLQDSLESGGSVASHQSNGQNGVGGSLQTQQHVRQQQLSLCRGGGVGGSVQASGSNLMSSYGNGFPSVSGGGVSAYSRGDSCVQQNMDGGSVVQQQQQAQGKHHGSSSGVHQLLQEMMMNQQVSQNQVALRQGVGVGGNPGNGMVGNLSESLGGNVGLSGDMVGVGGSNNVHNLGAIVSSQVGMNRNSGEGVVGSGNSVGIGGVGSSGAHPGVGSHSARGMGGGARGNGVGGLSGLMGHMNAHNARLNLAAAVAQQQQQHNRLQELGGSSMLGGLGMAGSFGGLFN